MRFPIEFGHIVTFARSIGDPNPIYHDEEYAATTEFGRVIAPPTFVRASAQFDPDYTLRPRIGEPWFGSAHDSSGIKRSSGEATGENRLHAEQHFEYHRPVRVGDVLVPTQRLGESWEREGRRGGSLFFQEAITEYRDENDVLVVTTRSVAVRTSRPLGSD